MAVRALAVFMGDASNAARLLARSTAVFAVSSGLTVLVGGWGLHVHLLQTWAAGLPVVAPNSALSLVLLGVALWLRTPSRGSRPQHLLALGCAGLITLLGLATLAEYSLRKDLGVDRLLPFPGRPAPNSALCFTLLGLALLTLDRPRRRGAPWADLLVIPAFLIALVAFNGYVYGAFSLVDLPHLFHASGMSLPATLGVLALSAGTLCARPEQGLMARLTGMTLGGLFARLLLPLLLLLPPMTGLLLEVLHVLGPLSGAAENALFSTVTSASGIAIALFSAGVLDRLDTQRKHAEAERERLLAQSQTARAEAEAERVLLRAVLEHAPVGMLFVEPEADRVLDNPALRTMLGPPSATEGEPPRYDERLCHADGRPVSREELPSVQVLRGQRVDAGEYLLVRPDGTRTPVLLTAAPVRRPSGELHGGVLTFQDLSARQELERLKEEYVGLISHDLRTPLQTLSLRLELLLRQLRARELATETATAENLQRSVQRMGGMIDELLEGTRLESGRVELDRAPVELRRLLAEVLERDVPPSERERFRLECPAAPRPVLADAARLTRVVVNLLTNALKYSPPGSPVEVRLVDEDARVRVTVRDQGPGLRPEEAERLFQKYYRTRSTARKSEGLGLGLYISRLIVEAHGGRIWVESTPGQGAAFSFSLPREPPGPPAVREAR